MSIGATIKTVPANQCQGTIKTVSVLAGSGQTSMLIKVGQRRFRCQSVPLSKQCQPISVREQSKLCQKRVLGARGVWPNLDAD